MNKREDALKEALQNNEEETQRWQAYLKENETAIENMGMFSRRLSVEVMVPVGKKALMPGHLIHTNEVLVGHYQGYFSKCTTFKAKEICELRIKMAMNHLRKLETEVKLWQNKLEKPYAEGVLPTGKEREIIEDYDEENEKLWKEKHRLRVKEAKQREREENDKLMRQNDQKKLPQTKETSDNEIFKMLEEAELMEVLELELDKLEVKEINDDTIRKLMSGEMKLPPEKKRIAHEKKPTNEKDSGEVFSVNIVKKNEIKSGPQTTTNNNVLPNPEINNFINTVEENEIEDEPIPEEVIIIKEQATFLTPEDQIGFYEYQIQIIRQKLQVLPLRSQEQLDEKIRLLSVLEHLEELLETAEITVGEVELAERNFEIENNKEEVKDNCPEGKRGKKSLTNNENKSQQKRSISFSLDHQTIEFCKNEAVNQMLPPKQEKLTRDAIILRDNDGNKNINATKVCREPASDKKDLIQEKVIKNLQFVSENQSEQDFDLVEKIIQHSTGEINTLYIKFQHSKQESFNSVNTECNDIPHCPADFYDLYVKLLQVTKENESTLFINSYEGEDKVKAPVLKEVDRKEAFVDPKAEYSNPNVQAKSILKNKMNVEKENHCNGSTQNNKNKKTKRKTARDEDECLSAYYKVMNDVVEKPLTEPEPLPDVKFIDAHAPKKRISRFKQMRQGTEKI